MSDLTAALLALAALTVLLAGLHWLVRAHLRRKS